MTFLHCAFLNVIIATIKDPTLGGIAAFQRFKRTFMSLYISKGIDTYIHYQKLPKKYQIQPNGAKQNQTKLESTTEEPTRRLG